MRPVWKTLSVLGLLGLGYVLGAAGTLSPRRLGAQAAAQAGGPSEESRKKLSEAFSALKAAAETLEQENLYVSATSNLNVFAITKVENSIFIKVHPRQPGAKAQSFEQCLKLPGGQRTAMAIVQTGAKIQLLIRSCICRHW